MTDSPKLCYLLSDYISHYTAGVALRDCIESLGVEVVDRPDRADVVVIHNEPWSYAGYYRAFPELRDRYVVAYAVWETDKLPEHYRHNLGLVDEVWTCSSYCREALSPFCDPTTLIPHVVKPPKPVPDALVRIKERIGYEEDAFYFYTIANGSNPRKNLQTALQAFDGLFSEDNVRFIVKSNRPLPDDMPRPRGMIEVSGHLDESEVAALHHLGQCFVSAHHAEGWGLGLSDAMACGNLVVASGYSGNMEFMNEENSLPVDYRISFVGEKALRLQKGLLTEDMKWAYVDSGDLRRKLRKSYDEWSDLAPLREQAKIDVQRFLPERVAQIIDARLSEVVLNSVLPRLQA